MPGSFRSALRVRVRASCIVSIEATYDRSHNLSEIRELNTYSGQSTSLALEVVVNIN
jgi:hypothetical protein